MNPKFTVGDAVYSKIVNRIVTGEILSVQVLGSAGPILYSVDAPITGDCSEDNPREYVESELEAVPSLAGNERFPVQKVMGYLKSGGLLDILRCGDGGKNPPRALLREQGNGLIYTWIEDDKHLQGASIPFSTLEPDKVTGKNKIFGPSKPRIVLYLRGFGLTRDQASDVVDSFPTYRP